MNNKNHFVSYKNRGMLLEKLLNNTIDYYNKYEIAFFSKTHLNIKFHSVNKNNNLEINSSFIKSKSTVDYYGVYNGKYITFEAKSTEEKSFHFSNIKPHQHKHLKLIKKLGGKAFYIIMFKRKSNVFLIDVEDIDYENNNSISYEQVQNVGKTIEIIFPGIIDFLNYI